VGSGVCLDRCGEKETLQSVASRYIFYAVSGLKIARSRSKMFGVTAEARTGQLKNTGRNMLLIEPACSLLFYELLSLTETRSISK
jgi:hypothetical protein